MKLDRKRLKGSRGSSLIEVIISLAVMGIISVPLMLGFVNSAVVMKLSADRLEINAAIRIIKENVIKSVKYGGGNTVPSYDTDASGKELEVDLQSAKNGSNLKIVGVNGEPNSKYKFDADRVMDFDNIADPGGMEYSDTCEYLITLRRMDGSLVQKLKILINKLNP